MKIVLSLLLSATLAFADSTSNRNIYDGRGHIFKRLRRIMQLKKIQGCGQLTTHPYGSLEHTFTNDSAADGDRCTFRVHAPPNQVVRIVVISYHFEDSLLDEPSEEGIARGSLLHFFDSDKPGLRPLQTVDLVLRRGTSGGFVSILSNKEDLVVQLEYHNNPDYATQKFRIKYEFLDSSKVREVFNNLTSLDRTQNPSQSETA